MSRDSNCVWCGKADGSVEQVRYETWNSIGTKRKTVDLAVHPEHRPDVDSFVEFENRYGRLFVLAVVLLAVAAYGSIVVGALFDVDVGVPLVGITAGFGVLFVVFPFATPLTVGAIGIKWSRRVVRAFGVVLFGLPFVVVL